MSVPLVIDIFIYLEKYIKVHITRGHLIILALHFIVNNLDVFFYFI